MPRFKSEGTSLQPNGKPNPMNGMRKKNYNESKMSGAGTARGMMQFMPPEPKQKKGFKKGKK